MQRYPMAASVAVADLVAGPRRRVAVVAATPHAVYLDAGDGALALVGPRAVRVPCGLLLADAPPPLAGVGWVGDSELSVGIFRAGVTRWWRPPRPRAVTGVLPGYGHLDHGTERALTRLTAALAARASLTAPVRGLLGRGPGLTPLGDDVLAGLLVTLRALGSPEADRLGGVVCALAPARTTFVSTALLRHAARGECVPELAAYLTAERKGPAAAALLGIGHTTGAGLLRGAEAAA